MLPSLVLHTWVVKRIHAQCLPVFMGGGGRVVTQSGPGQGYSPSLPPHTTHYGQDTPRAVRLLRWRRRTVLFSFAHHIQPSKLGKWNEMYLQKFVEMYQSLIEPFQRQFCALTFSVLFLFENLISLCEICGSNSCFGAVLIHIFIRRDHWASSNN